MEALARYAKEIPTFEKRELYNVQEVYYLGLEAEKYRPIEVVPLLAQFRVNKGFDDPDGYLRVAADDHIGYRYQI